jgi:hypothetical protein
MKLSNSIKTRIEGDVARRYLLGMDRDLLRHSSVRRYGYLLISISAEICLFFLGFHIAAEHSIVLCDKLVKMGIMLPILAATVGWGLPIFGREVTASEDVVTFNYFRTWSRSFPWAALNDVTAEISAAGVVDLVFNFCDGRKRRVRSFKKGARHLVDRMRGAS